MREPVKDWSGWIVGWLDRQPNGNVIAYGYNMERVGEYDKNLNLTRDSFGRVLADGDITAALIYASGSNKR